MPQPLTARHPHPAPASTTPSQTPIAPPARPAAEAAPQFRQVRVGLLDGIVGALSMTGRVLPALTAKAALARIGRYCATESMLVLDPVRGACDADATPSTGSETLFDLYPRLVRGEAAPDRGEHAVF